MIAHAQKQTILPNVALATARVWKQTYNQLAPRIRETKLDVKEANRLNLSTNYLRHKLKAQQILANSLMLARHRMKAESRQRREITAMANFLAPSVARRRELEGQPPPLANHLSLDKVIRICCELDVTIFQRKQKAGQPAPLDINKWIVTIPINSAKFPNASKVLPAETEAEAYRAAVHYLELEALLDQHLQLG